MDLILFRMFLGLLFGTFLTSWFPRHNLVPQFQRIKGIKMKKKISPLSHSLTYPPTHSPTHSFTHSPTHSLTHSLIHPPTHSLTHSPTHSLTLFNPTATEQAFPLRQGTLFEFFSNIALIAEGIFMILLTIFLAYRIKYPHKVIKTTARYFGKYCHISPLY